MIFLKHLKNLYLEMHFSQGLWWDKILITKKSLVQLQHHPHPQILKSQVSRILMPLPK